MSDTNNIADELLLDVLDACKAGDRLEVNRAICNLRDANNHWWPLPQVDKAVALYKRSTQSTMKRRYKMLPLSFPFTHEREFWADCVGDEIAPRFNRNGRYMDRKKKQAWIEVDGRAWLYKGVETFLHDLAHTGVRRLVPRPCGRWAR